MAATERESQQWRLETKRFPFYFVSHQLTVGVRQVLNGNWNNWRFPWWFHGYWRCRAGCCSAPSCSCMHLAVEQTCAVQAGAASLIQFLKRDRFTNNCWHLLYVSPVFRGTRGWMYCRCYLMNSRGHGTACVCGSPPNWSHGIRSRLQICH